MSKPTKSLRALAVEVIEAWNNWTPDSQSEGELERLQGAIDALAAKLGMVKK